MKQMIEAQTGVGFELKKSQRLKIETQTGQQVSDLFCFAKNDISEALSSGKSIDYNDTLLFTQGHVLYSQYGKPMLKIVGDSCRRHDFLVTPCSQQMFEQFNHETGHHPSCLENLTNALAPFGVEIAQIGTTFNAFMNVEFNQLGKIKVQPPLARANDFISFEAQMDLIVGLTACADEGSNGGQCKPITFEIF